jgi:nucleotide-binding universal stress UspA family protein
MTMQDDGQREHRIVVGVDGSSPSKAALAWAVRQAGLTGAAVDVVAAWEFPSFFPTPWPPELGGDWKELAQRVVTEAVAELPEAGSHVEIRPQVAEGNAAQVLLDASAGADLLVVGSRGHGGFAEVLLGSVSQHCVHHATCPVVVIRE